MAFRTLSICSLLLAGFRQASAQIGPDPNWLNPDGSKSDFTSAYTAGKTITLSWKALNSSKSDLWLTHWNSNTYPWYDKVASGVDISTAGSLSWFIDVPESETQTDNNFVLRFFPAGAAYGPLQFAQKASPGFILTGGTLASSSVTGAGTTLSTSVTRGATSSGQSTGTASTSTTATSASISSSSVATSLSSATTVVTSTNAAGGVVTATVTTSVPVATGVAGTSQNASDSNSSSGLPLGAQVGIGVGVGVFVVLLFIAGCVFGRRYGIGRTLRSDAHGLEKEGFPMPQNSGIKSGKVYIAEAEGTLLKPSSISKTAYTDENHTLISTAGTDDEEYRRWYNSRTPWTEAGGDHMHPVEKDGAMVRPGLHEVG